MVLSHPHRDHVSLLPDVIKAFPVGEIWDSGRFWKSASYGSFLQVIAEHPPIHYHTALHDFDEERLSTTGSGTRLIRFHSRMVAGPVPIGRDATMTFLHVDGAEHSDPNDNSVVVRLDLGTHRVLLMGDADGGERSPPESAVARNSIEGKLLACCTGALRAEVLVVGHHGSMTSSRRAFLDAVGARVFAVSSGPHKYGKVTLPDSSVVEELRRRGEVFRTDLDDEACRSNPAKVGPDNDGKPGGVTISSSTFRRMGRSLPPTGVSRIDSGSGHLGWT